jgi:hypothetical protein
MQNTIKQQQDKIRQGQNKDIVIRARQQKEIKELQTLLEQQQKEIQKLRLQQQPALQLTKQTPPIPSLSIKSKAKEPQQPSSYKPHSLKPAKSAQPRSHQAKPSSNICQIVNHSNTPNMTPRSLQISPSTNTSAGVVA